MSDATDLDVVLTRAVSRAVALRPAEIEISYFEEGMYAEALFLARAACSSAHSAGCLCKATPPGRCIAYKLWADITVPQVVALRQRERERQRRRQAA